MTVPVTRALFVTKEKLHCLPFSMALLRENRSRDKLLQKAYWYKSGVKCDKYKAKAPGLKSCTASYSKLQVPIAEINPTYQFFHIFSWSDV